jgi:hypothetical protein
MRRSLIGGKKFHNFHWTRKTSSRKGHEKVKVRKKINLVFFLEEDENECMRG